METDIRLSDLQQWLPWKYVQRENGKLGKPPIDHRTGAIGDGRDRGMWMGYDDATAYARRHGLPGVGFMPTTDDPFCFIDLDGCVVGGQLSPLAGEVLAQYNTYAELSPSRTGLHVIVKTKQGVNLNRQRDGIEVYSHNQFVTWTGQRWPGAPNRVAWADLAWLLGRCKPAAPPPVAICGYQVAPSVTKPAVPLRDDDDLWQLIWRVDRTGRALRLYAGDLSVVGDDHSLGVLTILNTLAKFTQGDRHRMRRMIAQTSLPTAKWDRPLNGGTWLDYQINDACNYMGV
jgi:putative DNA primase/helicase